MARAARRRAAVAALRRLPPRPILPAGHVPAMRQRKSLASRGIGTRQSAFVQRGPSRAGAGLKADTPYAVLLVDLEEGPRMISTYTGGRPEEVTFDMNVMLVCERIDDTTTLPRFRRA
ncbi:MAG: Zn-ribbon domain-containing OB-fold protein [Terriglobia bacterium]